MISLAIFITFINEILSWILKTKFTLRAEKSSSIYFKLEQIPIYQQPENEPTSKRS